jgi:hypothetical protein
MGINRLEVYIKESKIHIDRLENVLNRLHNIYPLTKGKFDKLTPIEKDALDTLAFRFSKLQDLLGSKIFREYLREVGFIVEGKTFWELVREMENEEIIDIDLWSEFRKVRNLLAHDYPDEIEEKVEAINYLIEKNTNINMRSKC